jgi:leucyl aminopeptidase
LEFSIKSGNPEKQRTACIVVGIYASSKLSAAATAIDSASQGAIAKVLRRGDMEGKLATTLILHDIPGVEAERVLLVGLGKEDEFRDAEYRKAVAASVQKLNETGSPDATLFLPGLAVAKRDTAWCIRQAVLAASDTLYRFDALKSKGKEQSKRPLRQITLAVTTPDELQAAKAALQEGIAIASGVDWAKSLGNLPGNICTPTYLADEAKALAKEFKLGIDVLDAKKMAKLGMHSLLSVAKGSIQPPRFIVLKHEHGKSGDKPLVLVGKGITFDSGGISLKPGPEMDEMKYDMCGAASVLGAMRAAAMLKLPLNIVALIPTTENMPGGAASKPGDIVTSMSGQTIEILNTDAEGRLILCDALTYAERFEPECVIDVATLTGACVIALGHVATGLFANNDDLGRELLDAGQKAGDRAWQLPLWDDYQDQLKSNFADMANIGGRPAGSITAASFLARFTKKYAWAHLDIAGTAWTSGKDKGSTGRPVALLTQFLMQRSANAKPAGKQLAKKAPK